MSIVTKRFKELAELIPEFEFHAQAAILNSGLAIASAFKSGNKLLICGNGGSAADSQHLAAEFINAFASDITRVALPAIALSTDTSVITAIANDFSFENIFARQVEAYAKAGDILIVITTSGSSQNCLKAVNAANSRGVTTIALTRKGGVISNLADISIEVPSSNTQHIQECHMLSYHILTEIVENELFRKDN